MLTIGWREKVDLPDWGITRLKSKMDTGARTSAVDVAEIQHLDNGDIRFKVVVRTKPKRKVRWVTATPLRSTIVKPSSGIPQERIVCETTLVIGGVSFKAEVSLINREGMLCRMLVGRTALEGRFLVDSAHPVLVTPPLNR